MSAEVTLKLSDASYRYAQRLAQLAGRAVADILADTIELALPPFSSKTEGVKPIGDLSNAEVLQLAELQLEPKQDKRLSQLLHKQQVGQLTHKTRRELLALMQSYQEQLLRKAQALQEVVRRGLRKPLS